MKRLEFVIWMLVFSLTGVAQVKKVSSTIKACDYFDFMIPSPLTGTPMRAGHSLEVSYSSKDGRYGIDYELGNRRVMVSCRYDSQLRDGRFRYVGIEVNTMREAQVLTKVKLDKFLKYYGQEQLENFEEDKKICVEMAHVGPLYIYPLKNTPELYASIRERQEAKELKKKRDIELLERCLFQMENRKIAHAPIDEKKIIYKIKEYEIENRRTREDRIKYLLQDEVAKDYKLLLYINLEECKPAKIDYEVLDEELYKQYNPRINTSYLLNGVTYYQVGTGFFFEKQFNHQMLCGRHTITIKKKKSEIVYYKGEGFYKTKVKEEDLPLVILNKIQSDITGRGTYVIDYVFVNDSILRFDVRR